MRPNVVDVDVDLNALHCTEELCGCM